MKDRSEFYASKVAKDGMTSGCRACHMERQKKHYLANRELCIARSSAHYKKMRALGISEKYSRRSHLRRKFGITPEQYEAMYRKQNGACAVCLKHNLNGWRLAVDHCHKTGNVRGLLCTKCNTALGAVGDSLKLLTALFEYIEMWGRISAVRA